jgi:BirA family biotin operon repressor/biotin-[acetyl-CoA-carboxylase] ligase
MTELRRYSRLESTQLLAASEARAGAAPGITFVAEAQTGGRGRLDHRWVSPPGGTYLSTIVSAPAAGLSLVPLAVAGEVAALLRSTYGVETRIRWPNDLWIAPRRGPASKLGGVLVERIEREADVVLVIGVGLNSAVDRRAFDPVLTRQVAVLSELTSTPVSLDSLEAGTIGAIERALERLATPEGVRAIVAECRDRLDGVGRKVRLDGIPVGTLVGIGEDGALLVEDGNGPGSHLAGTLSFEGDRPGK